MKDKSCLLYENEKLYYEKYKYIAGVDEAGRGPLAGPLVVAAVILDPERPIVGVYDSKRLTDAIRKCLYEEILHKCFAYSVVDIDHKKIDEINILQALLIGIKKAISNLSIIPDFVLIDGNVIPQDFPMKALPVIKGDSTYASIAAASILAKVTRDKIMDELDKEYPQYGFRHNKGYGTKEHLAALDKYGPCPVHRFTYTPVQQYTIWNIMPTN